MLLLLMRHGIAEEPRPGQDDADRALTEKGWQKTGEAMKGLHALCCKVECIASSPLRRAVQTGQIAARFSENQQLQIWPELESAQYSRLAERLSVLDETSILLVGHEPGFTHFAARLLTGKENAFAMEFKKAGVCAIEVDWSTPDPSASLLWHATPKMLRSLGGASKMPP